MERNEGTSTKQEQEKAEKKITGICQRKNRPGWWVRIYHVGKTTWYRCDTKSQAKTLYGKLKGEIREGTFFPEKYKPQPPQAAPVLLRDYVRTWLAAQPIKGKKASTIKTYEYRLNKHVLPTFGRMPLPAVTRPKIKTWAAHLLDTGMDFDTVQACVLTLSAVLSDAVDDQHLDHNPSLRSGKMLKRPPTIEEDEDLAIFTPQEEQAVLQAAKDAPPLVFPLILTFLRTGLRCGEVLGLHRDDLDFRQRVMHVRRQWSGWRITTPKTRKSRRRVDMSQGLAVALRAWIEVQDLEAAQSDRSKPEVLFTGNLGGKRQTPSYLNENYLRYRIWYPLLLKAEVRRLDLHACRHTVVSRLISNGENLKYISEQLGHSSIRVTADVYGHLIPGGNRQAVDRLDGVTVGVGEESRS